MSKPKPPRTARTYLSWVLFAISTALFVAVAVIWYRGEDEDIGVNPPPSSTPGRNEAIHVKQALEAKGLKVAFAPGGGRSDELTVAGQLFEVDGTNLFVFIYPQGPEQREDDSAEVELSEMTIVNTRGTPEPGAPPAVFVGSNVIGVLYGESDEISSKVQTAIEGLP